MKPLIIIILYTFLVYSLGFSCGTHGTQTQAEVDALNCINITNSVTAETNVSLGDPIENLNSLISIQTVGTDLIIRNNPFLKDISGLSNLSYIGGRLIIENNPMLTECCALNKLINEGTVVGGIIIRNNGSEFCNNDAEGISLCNAVPTLSQWGLTILGICLLILGVTKIRNGLLKPNYRKGL